MKIAVWRTGHEIADRVAISLEKGMPNRITTRPDDYRAIQESNAVIGYGILRGTAEAFQQAEASHRPWFNVDRGYFNPGHFDGYYRISYRGTQLKWHPDLPRKPIDIKLEPRRITGDYVLICPPTQAVCDFFGINYYAWEYEQIQKGYDAIWRRKDCQIPLEKHLSRASSVVTFNSSVGWKALQMGVPVLSDINHSAIGSFYNCSNLKTLTENFHNLPDNRIELFEAMNASQFTLAEIEQGKAWPLMSRLLSLSDTTQEKPSVHMSPLTA